MEIGQKDVKLSYIAILGEVGRQMGSDCKVKKRQALKMFRSCCLYIFRNMCCHSQERRQTRVSDR